MIYNFFFMFAEFYLNTEDKLESKEEASYYAQKMCLSGTEKRCEGKSGVKGGQ